MTEPESASRLLGARRRLTRALRAATAPEPGPDALALRRVEERLAHVEALVEGLQDAVHRDSVRHETRITELEAKLAPETLAKALSEDARRRGL